MSTCAKSIRVIDCSERGALQEALFRQSLAAKRLARDALVANKSEAKYSIKKNQGRHLRLCGKNRILLR